MFLLLLILMFNAVSPALSDASSTISEEGIVKLVSQYTQTKMEAIMPELIVSIHTYIHTNDADNVKVEIKERGRELLFDERLHYFTSNGQSIDAVLIVTLYGHEYAVDLADLRQEIIDAIKEKMMQEREVDLEENEVWQFNVEKKSIIIAQILRDMVYTQFQQDLNILQQCLNDQNNLVIITNVLQEFVKKYNLPPIQCEEWSIDSIIANIIKLSEQITEQAEKDLDALRSILENVYTKESNEDKYIISAVCHKYNTDELGNRMQSLQEEIMKMINDVSKNMNFQVYNNGHLITGIERLQVFDLHTTYIGNLIINDQYYIPLQALSKYWQSRLSVKLRAEIYGMSQD